MNTEAMRQAIRVVETADPTLYSHERWRMKDGRACAAFHCGGDPWFVQRGLVAFDGAKRGGTEGAFGVAYDVPGGQSLYSFEALSKFFDLPKYGAASSHTLFGVAAYEDRDGKPFPGAQQKAIFLSRAREAIEHYEAEASKGLKEIM